jgi:hypothetical protein
LLPIGAMIIPYSRVLFDPLPVCCSCFDERGEILKVVRRWKIYLIAMAPMTLFHFHQPLQNYQVPLTFRGQQFFKPSASLPSGSQPGVKRSSRAFTVIFCKLVLDSSGFISSLEDVSGRRFSQIYTGEICSDKEFANPRFSASENLFLPGTKNVRLEAQFYAG